jgi:uncharacterized protein (TIGR01777 family)
MATVLITGGTGLVGKRLTEMLVSKGYEVIIVTRQIPLTAQKNIQYALWNVEAGQIDSDAINKSDYIIHLAGAGVADKRWTNKRKKEIVDSRIKSCELLVKALRTNENKIKAVISASAIGWYGPDPSLHENGFDENDIANTDFLGETCKEWESSIQPTTLLGKRLVILRTGIVLSKYGGALKEFLTPLKFGVAAILGNGKQKISWIDIDDLCAMYINAIENNNWHGSYNAVATSPVSNKQLTLALAKKLRGKFFIPIYVPGFVLNFILGEMSIEVLKSCTVSSKKIQNAGYNFLYPTIESSLDHLLKK